MTAAIASFQRREPLLRLLESLARDLGSDPEVARAVDVVVVLDGSTDGSDEAVAALDFPVPLTLVSQRHQGLAAARNAGAAAARGELVWFLDDDLVASPGLAGRHLRAARPQRRVMLGPCFITADAATPTEVREWWDARYAGLASLEVVDRFELITLANASMPVELFRSLGGLDETFTGFGYEDYEFAFRLLGAGGSVVFDPEAVAWHVQHMTLMDLVRKLRAEGTNAIALYRRHPETAAFVLQQSQASLPLLDRSARRLALSASAAAVSAQLADRYLGRRFDRARRFSRAAAFAAGVADAGGDDELRELARQQSLH